MTRDNDKKSSTYFAPGQTFLSPPACYKSISGETAALLSSCAAIFPQKPGTSLIPQMHYTSIKVFKIHFILLGTYC